MKTKNPNQNMSLNVAYNFKNAAIGYNFNNLIVPCSMVIPSCS